VLPSLAKHASIRGMIAHYARRSAESSVAAVET